MPETHNITELRFGNQALGFGADEFLFKLDDLGALRLLVLELSNLVGDLYTVSMSCRVPRLYRTLALWSRLG
jgi:hypothetical protein